MNKLLANEKAPLLRIPLVLISITMIAYLLGAATAGVQILDSSLPSGVVNSPYAAPLYASGGTAPYSWAVKTGTTLPAGFLVSGSALTGTPVSTGSYTVVIQVTDATGIIASHSFTVVVASTGIVTTDLPGAVKGVAYSATLAASGGTPPYSWSLNQGKSGQLPSGLTLSSSGTISGTPAAAGYDGFTLKATDSKGQHFSQTLAIDTVMPLVISSSTLPSGTVGKSYSASLGASGGSGPYNWKVVAGSPPSVIGVNGSGAVSGTPIVAGAFGFTVQVSDVSGQQVNAPVSIAVAAPVAITTTSLPSGAAGTAYSTTVGASGGTAPYTWTITAGTLPGGLALNSSTGAVSGTPAAAGSSTFTLQVKDSAGGTSSQSFTVIIAAAPLSITTSGLPNGESGVAYSATLAAKGGTPPYTWSIASGQLPAGVALSPTAGTISGTPTTAGSYSVTVHATDSAGAGASASLAFTMAASLTITSSSLPGAASGVAYSAALAATGGTAPYNWTVASGQLPMGLTLSAAGSITGTPSSSGSFGFVAQVTDSARGSASQSFTVGVSGASSGPSVGGLVSWPNYTLSPNQVLDSGFESGIGTPWYLPSGMTLDTNPADCHSGSQCAQMDPTAWPPVAELSQNVTLPAGTYEFGGWIRTAGVTGPSGSGVRIVLNYTIGGLANWTNTAVVGGTVGWTQYTLTTVHLDSPQTVSIELNSYGGPTGGTAWFDDMFVIAQQTPVNVFMLYPNYRGILFSDQSQVIRLNVAVQPPLGSGGAVGDYTTTCKATDQTTSATLATVTHTSVAQEVITFDATSYSPADTYLLACSITGDGSTYNYPAYRALKMPASSRSTMNISVDANNRTRYLDVPTFIVGVYDSDLGYVDTVSAWNTELTNERNLYEIPANFYHNYGFGAADNTAILSLQSAVGAYHMYAPTTYNCFDESLPQNAGSPGFWFSANQGTPSVITARTGSPGFAGFYLADECGPDLAQPMFQNFQLVQQLAPGTIGFGVLLPDSNITLWRDNLDVVGDDPYPMWGPEPAGGYNFSRVWTGQQLLNSAVMSSRPTIQAIQYFIGGGASRYPTQAELRNMSYMAIAGGANGLLYWELGDGGPAVICGADTTWCSQRVALQSELIAVISEIQSLQAPLTAVDDTTTCLGNSQSASIQMRCKTVNGTTYVIATNITGSTVNPTFTMSGSIVGSVTAYNESYTVTPSGASFSDSFTAYAAHVYVVAVN